MSIDWVKVNDSFGKYFARIGMEGCYVEFDDVIFVFSYEDIKFENEDRWGDDE